MSRRHSIDHFQTTLDGQEATLMDTLRQYYGDGMGEDYTDVNILRREAMRFEPQILEILNKIWTVADHDSSRSVTEEEYHIMFRRLARVLVHGDVDPEELEEMAQEEFEQDVSCTLASSCTSYAAGSTHVLS